MDVISYALLTKLQKDNSYEFYHNIDFVIKRVIFKPETKNIIESWNTENW